MPTPIHSLPLALETILAATNRILPSLLANPTPSNIYDTYISLTPLVSSFWLTHILILLQLILSVLTQSYSWNDRFWSFIPPLHALIYTLHSPLSKDTRTNSLPDPRLCLMTFSTLLWGSRLTFNGARRGYYDPGFLDHRYTWLRRHVVSNGLIFRFSYAITICGYMTFLLAAISSPFYLAWLYRATPLSYLDFLATILILFFIAVETIADNQQYSFQTSKKNWQALSLSEKELLAKKGLRCEERDGFVQTGLFAWSRHPNFFAEMSVWACFYLFSVGASGLWFNWTIIGPLAYIALFQVTTPLTEHISVGKYPAYRDYQRRVSRILPSPFSKPVSVARTKKEE